MRDPSVFSFFQRRTTWLGGGYIGSLRGRSTWKVWMRSEGPMKYCQVGWGTRGELRSAWCFVIADVIYLDLARPTLNWRFFWSSSSSSSLIKPLSYSVLAFELVNSKRVKLIFSIKVLLIISRIFHEIYCIYSPINNSQ